VDKTRPEMRIGLRRRSSTRGGTRVKAIRESYFLLPGEALLKDYASTI